MIFGSLMMLLLIGVPLVGIMHAVPLLWLFARPLIAGAAMAFSSVIVVGNANCLRGFRPKFSAR